MRFLRGYWLLLVGLLVTAFSIVAIAVQMHQVVGFGWTAYAPLTSTTFTPAFTPYVPFITFAIGLGLIGAWIGYRAGRSKTR